MKHSDPVAKNGRDSRYRLGIDIGGTFTDLCVVNAQTGDWIGLKTPTVPTDVARGVAHGLDLLRQRGIAAESIEYFVHGTTIGLNTVIQRAARPVALVVTNGFRDVLEIARLRLPIPWNFYSNRALPLIPREYVVELGERMLHTGQSLRGPAAEELDRVVDEIERLDVEGVAICLLHSYANPTHELALKERLLQRLPALFVSSSAEVWPQIREYERSLVTVLNTYIRPAMVRYLNGLEATLTEQGMLARPYLTRSNGGIMTTTASREEPVQTLLSGPASGVMGASLVAAEAGFRNVITFDVGGTSADVALIEEGEVAYSREEHVGDFPVILPAIAISSIGAGGGSIGWIDGSEILHVGPRSAGADPGPACYGLGGREPALTDAFLVSGYLAPERFAGGRTLDRPEAEKALSIMGQRLQRTAAGTADAMVRVALANMYTELSGVLERKGVDPRDFTLVAFGGAGPVLACLLAEEVNISSVLVPKSPGTLCALGALRANVMSDFIRSVYRRVDSIDARSMVETCASLESRASEWLEREAPPVATTELRWSADMRYLGQSYEIDVPLEERWVREGDFSAIEASFHDLHGRLFAHSDPGAPVELVNLRLRAVGLMPQPPVAEPTSTATGAPVRKDARDIVCRGERMQAAVHAREDLAPGHLIAGPAVIEQADSTCVIPAGWRGDVDVFGNLVLTRDTGGE